MARPRKEPIGAPADQPVKVNAGDAFKALVDGFKAAHPDTWETVRLCPLQHGLDVIAEALAQD